MGRLVHRPPMCYSATLTVAVHTCVRQTVCCEYSIRHKHDTPDAHSVFGRTGKTRVLIAGVCSAWKQAGIPGPESVTQRRQSLTGIPKDPSAWQKYRVHYLFFLTPLSPDLTHVVAWASYTHTHTHARARASTHARTHARTHIHTHTTYRRERERERERERLNHSGVVV